MVAKSMNTIAVDRLDSEVVEGLMTVVVSVGIALGNGMAHSSQSRTLGWGKGFVQVGGWLAADGVKWEGHVWDTGEVYKVVGFETLIEEVLGW